MKKTLFLLMAAVLVLSCEDKENPAGKLPGLAGAGSEAAPFVIDSADDFKTVWESAAAATTTYVQLGADIDMEGVADYKPFNCDEPYDKQIHFDGKGFTISNFKCDDTHCSYPSLFGVLYGSCRDLKIDGVAITSNGQPCGVVAGSVGAEGKAAVVENVEISDATVTTKFEKAGGVCGTAIESEFKNISFQGTVTSTYARKEAKAGGVVGEVQNSSFDGCFSDVNISVYNSDAGGFAGKVIGTADFTGCKTRAVVVSEAATKNRAGGFIGWNSSVKTTLTDCHVLPGSSLTDKSGRTTSASNGNYGGFIGFGDTDGTVLEITGCSASADVDGGVSLYNSCFISYLGYKSNTTIKDSHATGSVKSLVGNYAGGLIGHTNASAVAAVDNCYFIGDIYVTGGYVGGIAGGVGGKLTLSRTYSAGTVTGIGAYIGGLIGASMNDGVQISNCFSTAKVYGRGQQVGGLVGTTTNRLKMSDCYASGDVYSGTSGAAGLVGRVQKSSEITNCIAWNRNIGCSRSAYNVYAPGAILGCAQESGTYKGCIRRYDMILTDDFVVLSDQEDFVGAVPPCPTYSSESHQRSYHGKAAAPGATLASVAQSLGWNSEIWKFTLYAADLTFVAKPLGDNKIEF